VTILREGRCPEKAEFHVTKRLTKKDNVSVDLFVCKVHLKPYRDFGVKIRRLKDVGA
jgi:hypothetical protein